MPPAPPVITISFCSEVQLRALLATHRFAIRRAAGDGSASSALTGRGPGGSALWPPGGQPHAASTEALPCRHPLITGGGRGIGAATARSPRSGRLRWRSTTIGERSPPRRWSPRSSAPAARRRRAGRRRARARSCACSARSTTAWVAHRSGQQRRHQRRPRDPGRGAEQALLERLMAVNVIGTMLCCREAVRWMSTTRAAQAVRSSTSRRWQRPSAARGRTACRIRGCDRQLQHRPCQGSRRDGIRVNALRARSRVDAHQHDRSGAARSLSCTGAGGGCG